MNEWIRRYAKGGAALVLILAAYAAARPPVLGTSARAEMASRFRFTPTVLPEIGQPGNATVRTVHPSLERISSWISSVGASVALADLDGDGLPNDACSVDPRRDRVTVAAVSATDRYTPFDVWPGSLAHPSAIAPMGCLAGDFNEDGRRDLLVYFWGRTPLAFVRTDGALSAAGYTPIEIVSTPMRWYTNAATMADLDGDGHDDLIVGNYFPDGARILDARDTGPASMQHSMSNARNGGTKRLLLWTSATAGPTPDVRFTLADDAVGSSWATGWTLALAAADLDGDLLPEVYFANDFGPDQLLHNRSSPGTLRFEPLRGVRGLMTPKSKVLSDDSFKGMGVDIGWLDADDIPDIIVSNIGEAYALEESHFAFIGQGQTSRMRDGIAPYVDRSEALGLSRSGWGWDIKMADLDNDGTMEVLQTTGFIRGAVNRWPELHELAMGNDTLLANPAVWPRFQPGTELSAGRLFFFVRGFNGRYEDVARDAELGRAQIGRGLAIADVDHDGRLDFAVANQWEASLFYRNASPVRNAFLELAILRDRSQTAATATAGAARGPAIPATGAVVSVALPDGTRRTAFVDGGNGHSGRRSPEVHFGLGATTRDRELPVTVRWRTRTGATQTALLHMKPGVHTVRVPW